MLNALCNDCGKIIFNSDKATSRHRRICQTERNRVVMIDKSFYEDEDERDYQCRYCRKHEHLRCDGGDCRCTCSLELDSKKPRIYA